MAQSHRAGSTRVLSENGVTLPVGKPLPARRKMTLLRHFDATEDASEYVNRRKRRRQRQTVP